MLIDAFLVHSVAQDDTRRVRASPVDHYVARSGRLAVEPQTTGINPVVVAPDSDGHVQLEEHTTGRARAAEPSAILMRDPSAWRSAAGAAFGWSGFWRCEQLIQRCAIGRFANSVGRPSGLCKPLDVCRIPRRTVQCGFRRQIGRDVVRQLPRRGRSAPHQRRTASASLFNALPVGLLRYRRCAGSLG